MLSGFAIAEPDNNVPKQEASATSQQLIKEPAKDNSVSTLAKTKISVVPMSIPEKNLNQLKNIGQNTPQNKFLKFIIAMIGVIFSGFAIYGGLKIYKNLILQKNSCIINPNDERSLESPKDFKTAINIFLKKTDI